ncbi:hypothetical protein D9611_012039 [Ephemerocybe angulata]|uniref:Uncharacterized protein n=1 Tax=Ephemerocybe angulata TaxID=980116 RepID=A0A8H5ES34_9AGAR|nr:hypothetical protein D9611_012039 [Tulosesus angulatus]
MESRITLLSVTTEPPKAYGTALHIPGKTPPRHELHIDFQNCGTVTNPSFVSSVREAIEQNNIDAIVMLNCPNTPAPEIWTALEGAQPTHLEMRCGYLERCGYEELSFIKNFWPLKSVYLGSYLGGGDWLEDEDGDRQSPSFPACYATIETLVLNCPNARELFLYPTGGAQNLRSITIVENDALTTVRTVQCNPKMSETLRTVTIGCWASYQGTSPEEIQSMKDFFRQSKALVNLELVLNDPSSGWGANTLDAEGSLADIYLQPSRVFVHGPP